MQLNPENKKTILIVDDDAKTLAVISETLSRDGEYHILTASSGSKGLQVSRDFKEDIQLLLSDFEMPGGMSGADLATAMTRLIVPISKCS